MESLVEVHDEAELEVAVDVGAPMVGINNRDLRSFVTDLAVSKRLAPLVPKDKVIVSESGINHPEDLQALGERGVNAVLVGEALVTAPDVAAKVRELSGMAVPFLGGLMQVKICGVRTLEDALTAAEAGADFIGLVFVPGRRRRLETSHAAAIVSGVKNALPNAPKFVGLFADQPLSEVNRNHKRLRVGIYPALRRRIPGILPPDQRSGNQGASRARFGVR